jgi:hypothetical protein
MVIGFIGLFGAAPDYILYFTIIHATARSHSQLLGSGFQWRAFPFHGITERSQALSYLLIIRTAQRLNHNSPITNSVTQTHQSTPRSVFILSRDVQHRKYHTSVAVYGYTAL